MGSVVMDLPQEVQPDGDEYPPDVDIDVIPATAEDFEDPDPSQLQDPKPSRGRPGNRGTMAPSRLIAIEKRRRAFELRKAGATFAQIAEQVGYAHVSTAYEAVQTAAKELQQEPIKELRAVQYERLNHMLLTIWPKVNGGDERAIGTALQIMDKMDRLMGTDAATKVENVNVDAIVVVDGDRESFIQAMARMAGREDEVPTVKHHPAMGELEPPVDAELVEDDEWDTDDVDDVVLSVDPSGDLEDVHISTGWAVIPDDDEEEPH